MLQITNLHFNEDDLLQLIVATEFYMQEHPDCSPKIREAHKTLNNLWLELKTDEEYFIAEKPF